MYFDLVPKSKREDFFNYTYEYNELKKAIDRRDTIIALIGVRRVGKTSLMNVVYHELKMPKLWIDGRLIENPKKEILALIANVAETKQSKIFGKIEGVNLSAFGIGLNFKIDEGTDLKKLEKKIENAGRLCVFIDEAQKMEREDLADVLSYFYDHFPQVSFIISGSEVGLIEEVLGKRDINHPLYGRNIVEIKMQRLDRNRSIEFLERGFEQLKVNIKKDEIIDAVNEVDGLIGWLTLYGYRRGIAKSADALKETVDMAAQITASELSHFLRKRKREDIYLSILRRANKISWSELKARVEKDLGKTLNPRLFTFAVDELVKYSFLEKHGDEYDISDPLLFKATFLV